MRFKRIFAVALIAILAFSNSSVPAFGAESSVPPSTISESYIIMDADTGQVLLEKNMNKKSFPASITKILTVALGLENSALTDQVTVSREAVYAIEPNSSHIALQPDEIVTMKDLVYATMLPSANDAANVIAEHVSGTMSDFAVLMNEKAAALGCKNTHFVNANGLPDNNHYTTAYDMALITKYALTVPNFAEVFGGEYYKMAPTNKQAKQRAFGTEHSMLVQSKYYYEGTLGGKLGWTQESKHTMVTLAEKNGHRLICVVLCSPQKYDKFSDSIALFDYAFDNFAPMTFSGNGLKTFEVSHYRSGGSAENVNITCKKDYTFLVHSGVTEGDIEVRYNVPEYYADDDEIAPQVSFSVNSNIKSMYRELGSYPMDYQILALDTNAVTDVPVPKPSLGARFSAGAKIFFKYAGIALLCLLGLALLLLLVMLSVRFFNKARRWNRRRLRNNRVKQFEDPELLCRPLPRTAHHAPKRPAPHTQTRPTATPPKRRRQ